jgi:hypothetical protein
MVPPICLELCRSRISGLYKNHFPIFLNICLILTVIFFKIYFFLMVIFLKIYFFLNDYIFQKFICFVLLLVLVQCNGEMNVCV